jgi:hypothetical protein
MAFTADQLAAVEAAITTGELTVKIDDRLVTYRSVDELKAARDLIRADLAVAGSIAAPVRQSYVQRVRD